jgi:hypothetical protein
MSRSTHLVNSNVFLLLFRWEDITRWRPSSRPDGGPNEKWWQKDRAVVPAVCTNKGEKPAERVDLDNVIFFLLSRYVCKLPDHMKPFIIIMFPVI